MNPRPFVLERPQKTLILERGPVRKFEVARTKSREIVINRSMLPGPKGDAGGQRVDVMTGIVTGQTQFILNFQPSDTSIVRMFVNGQKFRAPSFTVAGQLVVWASEFLIEATDEIEFTY